VLGSDDRNEAGLSPVPEFDACLSINQDE